MNSPTPLAVTVRGTETALADVLVARCCLQRSGRGERVGGRSPGSARCGRGRCQGGGTELAKGSPRALLKESANSQYLPTVGLARAIGWLTAWVVVVSTGTSLLHATPVPAGDVHPHAIDVCAAVDGAHVLPDGEGLAGGGQRQGRAVIEAVVDAAHGIADTLVDAPSPGGRAIGKVDVVIRLAVGGIRPDGEAWVLVVRYLGLWRWGVAGILPDGVDRAAAVRSGWGSLR